MPTSTTEPIKHESANSTTYQVERNGEIVFESFNASSAWNWRERYGGGDILENGVPMIIERADLSKVVALMGAPTPEEIAERCAAIQAEWTPKERRRRTNGGTELEINRRVRSTRKGVK